MHASGDAQKIIVNADSLNANYSFKYSGNSQGASVYTFIDERQILFHSLVFSSAEREASFVVDGLLCNEEIKADIFSTDTHGFVRPAKSLTMTVAPKLLGMRPAVLLVVPYSNMRNKQLFVMP